RLPLCRSIALRRSPAPSAFSTGAGHRECEKCGLTRRVRGRLPQSGITAGQFLTNGLRAKLMETVRLQFTFTELNFCF
ncbi:hypothetical protein ACFW16_35860, partial [Inquilinus sp. NPDC058860]|uniref:hypothetical protein n=1 Tax=Inquilinus sp. NPDC058860 TaxID=3346652 RepID=UPI003692110C